MDNRRFDTAQVLASGILNKPVPQTDIPKDREQYEPHDAEYDFAGVAAVVDAVEAGKVVRASNYYGIPYAWKQSDGVYRCVLLQYRNVTEDETFSTAAEAAEWFEERYHATDG